MQAKSKQVGRIGSHSCAKTGVKCAKASLQNWSQQQLCFLPESVFESKLF